MKKKVFSILFAPGLISALTLVSTLASSDVAPALAGNGGTPVITPEETELEACTTVLVGKDATEDGSTMCGKSGDGPPFGRVMIIPRKTYEPGTMTPIYVKPSFWPRSQPKTYKRWLEWSAEKPVLIGKIPQVEETYRYIDSSVLYTGVRGNGMNEYGLFIGESTIPGRRELLNDHGLLCAYSNNPDIALQVIGRERAKTAREAIQVMGDLACEYGYVSQGESMAVSDANEVWAFEIFGPGADWTPGCGKPGAVWCAQRIPDGEVSVAANRSRIGEVPEEENSDFMFSSNIRSLALEKGWWDGTEPFVWYKAYGPRESRGSIMREWRVLSTVAPSLHLSPPPETGDQRYPFSVKPDHPLSVQDMVAIYRDALEGTPYDVTEDPAWLVDGEKSPMANPWGPSNLHKLLGVKAERSVGCHRSAFTMISQIRADLPDPIKGCLWFGVGAAPTTCYVPIYSGVTEVPESWYDIELNQISRENPYWASTLVLNLSLREYQNAIVDIKGVRDPAEATFVAQQREMESAVLDLYASKRSEVAAAGLAEKLVTKYTCSCMNAVSDGYWELVDYLLLKYYAERVSGATYILPSIHCPPVPRHPKSQR